MAKLYLKESFEKRLNPRNETISFLLNYSKSFRIVSTKMCNELELHLN